MRKIIRFAISSLGLTGLIAPPSTAWIANELGASDPRPEKALYDVFRLTHRYTLAQHRSHRSHSSHGSHRSSSGGGSYRAPAAPPAPRQYSPPPPPPPPRDTYDSSPPSSILPQTAISPQTLPGNSAKFSEIVKKVQAGLYARGYYTGVIDGLVGPATRASISKFQLDNKLPVTGSVTSEVLDALAIVAQ